MSLFDDILTARGLVSNSTAFLFPNYEKRHDPFLLPDMKQAVDRLVEAHKKQEHITIYGDYDIDGLTATTLLVDAFASFGFKNVQTFIPNRFVEGYGLTIDAVEHIIEKGAQLIVTVDCGSISHKEIERAAQLGVDVIVTDHHTMGDTLPPAVAVVNPKRSDHSYPFIDLAGVGVAFKLVQALQTRLEGLPEGKEKWLLDLVALGTVCDVVTLLDENRTNVYWGLQVLAKTRRPGLRALMAVAKIEADKLDSRSLGFGLGPRMNASGRLETALHSLEMLLATDNTTALEKAQMLDALNVARRTEQAKILKEAIIQAEMYANDPVLVVSGTDWNHGIVGIVAAKLLEMYKKPTYVLQEMDDMAKGSARSYGDFSAVAAIRSAGDIVTKGGGHTLAAGVTMPTANIHLFRQHVNEFYRSLKLRNQSRLLLPKADVVIADLSEITEELIMKLNTLEPFGSGNPEPILRLENVVVIDKRIMGAENQHIKLEIKDALGKRFHIVAFSAPSHFFVEPGELVTIMFQPTLNEWKGRRNTEGKLLHLETL